MSKIINFSNPSEAIKDVKQIETKFNFLSAIKCRALYQSLTDDEGPIRLFEEIKTGKEFVEHFIHPNFKKFIGDFHLTTANKINLNKHIQTFIQNKFKTINFALFFDNTGLLYKTRGFIDFVLTNLENINKDVFDTYFKLKNGEILTTSRIIDNYNSDLRDINDCLNPFSEGILNILNDNDLVNFLKHEGFKVTTCGFEYILTFHE